MMRILWIPHAAWHISQRAHLFVKALSPRHELHVTVFGDYKQIGDYLSLDYLQNFVYSRREENSLTLHRVPRISPALFFPVVRKLNNHFFQKTVEAIIEKQKIDVVVGTYVCPPPRNAPRLIFDLFDENVSQWRENGYEQLADEIEACEQAYFERADVVAASSSVLVDKAKASRTKAQIVHIPNGVELEQFANLAKPSGNKRIGSVANFEDIEEMKLLLDAAKLLENEGLCFYLAGRGKALDYAKQRLKEEALRHVEIGGTVSRESLPAVLNSFDVGLCIYRQSKMDDARSPMRVIAYSALGIPTVATDTEEIRRMNFPNILAVPSTKEAIAEGIQQALEMPRSIPENINDYNLSELVKRYEAVLGGEA